MILVSKIKQRRSLSAPSIAELRKRFGFEDVFWGQNAPVDGHSAQWRDDQKIRLSWCLTTKIQRGATVY